MSVLSVDKLQFICFFYLLSLSAPRKCQLKLHLMLIVLLSPSTDCRMSTEMYWNSLWSISGWKVPSLKAHKGKRAIHNILCSRWAFCNSKIFALINFPFFRYYETVSDVLSSVKKMEESLKRLKQARRTAALNPVGTNGGMSDDDKIRLQLALDVEYFGEQVS